jgi:hypothetical protein
MALGSTLTLPLTSGSKVLPLINGPDFDRGSEYYLRETLVSWRVLVRHSTQVKGGVTSLRHNVTATKRTFATSTTPEFDNVVSFTITAVESDSFLELANAIIGWLETSVSVTAASNATLVKLLGGES